MQQSRVYVVERKKDRKERRKEGRKERREKPVDLKYLKIRLAYINVHEAFFAPLNF